MGSKKWLAAAAGVLVIGIMGAGAVMAQSAQEDGTPFLDRVATKLGIGRDQLDQAIEDARIDQIDEAVAAGELTQEQADQLKERIEQLPADAPFLFGGDYDRFIERADGGPWSGHHGFHFGRLLHAGEDLAVFLGIDLDQLHEELQADGATLATVGEAHGKSRDDLKAFLQTQIDERLAQAVENGRLTQERADEISEGLAGRLDDFIDRGPGTKFRFRVGEDFPGMPLPDGEGEGDGDSTPEQSRISRGAASRT